MAPMDVMTAALASGYHGPPELTLQRAFTEWTLDPWALGFVLLLAGLYLAGARRVRRSGTAWPAADPGDHGTAPARAAGRGRDPQPGGHGHDLSRDHHHGSDRRSVPSLL